MCRKVVNNSTSESGCPGFKPYPSHCFFIDKELYSTLSLFTQVYKLMGTGDVVLRGDPAMDQHPIQGRVAIFLGMLHANETRISSGHSRSFHL